MNKYIYRIFVIPPKISTHFFIVLVAKDILEIKNSSEKFEKEVVVEEY